MAAVRSLLERVRRLEQAKVSPMMRMIGTPADFEAATQAGIDAGKLDSRDMAFLVPSVLRWFKEGF